MPNDQPTARRTGRGTRSSRTTLTASVGRELPPLEFGLRVTTVVRDTTEQAWADAEARVEQAIDTALSQAEADYELVVYPGAQHAYFFPGRPVHDAEAAADSWQRVAELFAATLRS